LSSEEKKGKEKPVKLEEVAEETGELVGKGLRKAWSVTKSFGKGLVDTLEKREDQKDTESLACPHCGASIPQDSNFCASCGKKLVSSPN
jgi:DNA-directed RNA polymerase subunit RPC12/RpoP